jgi:hypothetical protein
MFGLNLEQSGFKRGGAAQPQQDTGQSQHEFTLDRGLRVIIRDDGRFELPIIFGVFQQSNDGFRRQPMTDRVASGLLLSRLGLGPRAF